MAGHKYDLSLGIGLVDLPDQIDPVQLLPAQIKIQEIEIGPRIFCIKPSSSLPEAVRQAILAFCPQLSMDRFTSSEIVWSVKESSSQTITGSIKNLLQNNCFYRDRLRRTPFIISETLKKSYLLSRNFCLILCDPLPLPSAGLSPKQKKTP